MSLNNSQYCEIYNTSGSCSELASCGNISYQQFCQDADFFDSLSLWVEIPLDVMDIILSTIIIMITIFGKIDGTFKWCIMNIAIFHLFYPIFTRFIVLEGLVNLITRANIKVWGWSPIARSLILNGILAIGTQGVTTSIAGSLPLALNRFLLTHKSDLYKFFFGSNCRTFFWLLFYDLLIFFTFYLLYFCSTLNDFGIIVFSYKLYFGIVISTIVLTNSTALVLMIFVLYHIYSSLKLEKKLDQKQMIIARKRIAWVIVIQSLINFLLCLSRIIAFINVSLSFNDQPTMMCYNVFFNFYNYFGYCFQELFVCTDSLIYIFFLTPYREQLFIFFRKVLRRDKVHVLVVSNVSKFSNPRVVNNVQ